MRSYKYIIYIYLFIYVHMCMSLCIEIPHMSIRTDICSLPLCNSKQKQTHCKNSLGKQKTGKRQNKNLPCIERIKFVVCCKKKVRCHKWQLRKCATVEVEPCCNIRDLRCAHFTCKTCLCIRYVHIVNPCAVRPFIPTARPT